MASEKLNEDLRIGQLEQEGCNTKDAKLIAEQEKLNGVLKEKAAQWKARESEIQLPKQEEIIDILKNHPLVKLKERVNQVFIVGSFAKGLQNQDSDIDILIEVPPNQEWDDVRGLEDHYRQALRNYFVQNNIRGKADAVHPQWGNRRIDLYLTYDASLETRPKIKLEPLHHTQRKSMKV